MKRIVFSLVFLFVATSLAQAQTDCESMLEAANEYYNNGDFAKAARMYKMVNEDCGNDFGNAAARLKDCNHKLKEDSDFKKCTTIEACNAYLENYPNGRYVAKVKEKRSGLLNARAKAEDDAMYEQCTTIEDCELYLDTYPNGRHVDQVNALLTQLEEERREDLAYENCTTELACDYYMEQYPNGRYYWKVSAKKNTFVAERQRKEMAAAKTAYMNIQRVEFANVNKSGDIINGYGFTMYASEIMYLKPKIIYNGILDDLRYVTLDVRIIKPNGTVESNSNSPSGYTYSNSFYVETGSYNTYLLTGWGNDNKNAYVAGTYKFELWYDGSRIYQTSFVVKAKENALSRGNWRSALRKCRDYVMKTYDNGSYKGQTYDGVRSGLGMYSWNGGSYYIGNWSSGEKSGSGLYIASSGYTISNCPDCVYYFGGWSSGDKSGEGTCYDKLGNLIYYGSFANDKPTGTYPTSGYESFKFECVEYSSGDCYIGETFNGMRHGKGIYIWSSGDMWYGNWSNGGRDGYGIYMPYQGSVSTGTWKGDTKQ